MPQSCLLYYITDRTAFPGGESERRQRLLEKIFEATGAGVDYIQLREKDLGIRELESLAREATSIVRKLRTEHPELKTVLLINSRTDVALSVAADGVHLRSDDVSPNEVKRIWKTHGEVSRGVATAVEAGSSEFSAREPWIAISCHSPAEVVEAAAQGATFAVFGPVFEKKDAQPAGLDRLEEACRTNIPVLALGGITLANANSCLAAGAAGIATIRLFQENDVKVVVKGLRLNS